MKKIFKKMDLPLFILMILYIILGLVMILSASSVSAVLRYNVSTYYFFIRQFLFEFVTFFIGFIVLRYSTGRYKFPVYCYLVVVLVLLVLVFSLGIVAGGAQSWLDLGFFNLQPSEFAKTALILFMGVFYNSSLKKNHNFSYQLIPIVIAIVIFFFVAMEPDFGGAVIIAGIVFFTFLIIPFEEKNKLNLIKWIGFGAILGAIVLLYSGSDIFNSTQLSRLKFQTPCERYTEDTGYQVCNGFIAYHNGGLFGKGLGNSSQKYLYLPEAHTDFIFPILVEELGLIVGVTVILGYVYMLYRILKIGKNALSVRNSLICYGTFVYLLLHLLINLMGTLALIPLTGVPVPFLSYGGSFNMNVIMMMFIILRISYENKEGRENREIANLSQDKYRNQF